jgi:hypothetical protein
MRKQNLNPLFVALATSALMVFTSTSGLAQDSTVQSDNTAANTSTAEFGDVIHGQLKDEKLAFVPQVGVLEFPDQNGNHTERASAGLLIEGNATSWVAPQAENLYIGPETGAIYSHLGNTSSNFIGTSPTTSDSTDSGANLLVIPADLKLGYTFGDNFRLAVHGGGNLTYRTVGTSIDFGPATASTSPVWRIYPNAGADLELGLGRNIMVNFRPDVTFTPGNSLLAGTVGLGILIG